MPTEKNRFKKDWEKQVYDKGLEEGPLSLNTQIAQSTSVSSSLPGGKQVVLHSFPPKELPCELNIPGPLVHAFEHKYLHVPYGPCGCGLATEVPSYIFHPPYPLAVVLFSLIV